MTETRYEPGIWPDGLKETTKNSNIGTADIRTKHLPNISLEH
jgi:hypothetical protein